MTFVIDYLGCCDKLLVTKEGLIYWYDIRLQTYLYMIFHRTNINWWAHAICIPTILWTQMLLLGAIGSQPTFYLGLLPILTLTLTLTNPNSKP